MILVKDGSRDNEPMIPVEWDGSKLVIRHISNPDTRSAFLINSLQNITGEYWMQPGMCNIGIVHPNDDYDENNGYWLKSGRTGTESMVMNLVSMLKTYTDLNQSNSVQFDTSHSQPFARFTTHSSGQTKNASVTYLQNPIDNEDVYVYRPWSFSDGSGSSAIAGNTQFFHQPGITRGTDNLASWGYDNYATARPGIGGGAAPSRQWYLDQASDAYFLQAFLNVGQLRLATSSTQWPLKASCVLDQEGTNINDYRQTPGLIYDYPRIYINPTSTSQQPYSTRCIYPPAHPFSHPYHVPVQHDFNGSSANRVPVHKKPAVRYCVYAWIIINAKYANDSSLTPATSAMINSAKVVVPVNTGTINALSPGQVVSDPSSSSLFSYTSIKNNVDESLSDDLVSTGQLPSTEPYHSISGPYTVTGIRGQVYAYKTRFEIRLDGSVLEINRSLNKVGQPYLEFHTPADTMITNLDIGTLGWGLELWPVEVTKTTPWIMKYTDSENKAPNFEYSVPVTQEMPTHSFFPPHISVGGDSGTEVSASIITQDGTHPTVTSETWKSTTAWQPNAARSWASFSKPWIDLNLH